MRPLGERKRDFDWLIRDKYPEFYRTPRKYLPAIRRDVERLDAGEPLAYVIGWVPFLDAKIDLRYQPLIPRPETEYWTEKVIQKLVRGQAVAAETAIRVLDAFAGTGCVGLAVLRQIPQAHVTFADIDPRALRQIRINLRLNRIPPRRYTIKHSNILQNVGMSFDVILANPPYLAKRKRGVKALSSLRHEPATALFAGADGLAVIRKFLAQAPAHLCPGGETWLEFDASQKAAIAAIIKRRRGLRATFHRDQFGKWRWTVVSRK